MRTRDAGQGGRGPVWGLAGQSRGSKTLHSEACFPAQSNSITSPFSSYRKSSECGRSTCLGSKANTATPPQSWRKSHSQHPSVGPERLRVNQLGRWTVGSFLTTYVTRDGGHALLSFPFLLFFFFLNKHYLKSIFSFDRVPGILGLMLPNCEILGKTVDLAKP